MHDLIRVCVAKRGGGVPMPDGEGLLHSGSEWPWAGGCRAADADDSWAADSTARSPDVRS